MWNGSETLLIWRIQDPWPTPNYFMYFVLHSRFANLHNLYFDCFQYKNLSHFISDFIKRDFNFNRIGHNLSYSKLEL